MERTVPPVLVNEAFAARYFGREPAVGRNVDARFGENDAGGLHEVIGLVGDTKHDLRQPAAPIIYIPLTARTNGTIHVRASVPAAPLIARLVDEVRAGGMFRVASTTSQSAVIGRSMVREQLLALLSGFFALVGLLLAAIGLYGVLSDAVVQRTREIGIRMALGARRESVIQMVLAEVGITAVLGAAVGLGGGLFLSRFLETILFEVEPLDVSSLAVPLLTALAAACVAIVSPAIRATRVDPVIALRQD
jgi:predicted lysophospholipase L1 biosynthesis ABC-type transport system permease subunit